MLSFFAHPFIAPAACYEREPEPTLAPLFRLLGDFESYHGANQHVQPRVRRTLNIRPRTVAPFAPKFDVRETGSAYELHGELPGLERENVQIEFVDPQTLVVRGRLERTYENKPQQPEETAENTATETAPTHNEAEADAEAEAEVDWEDVKSTTSSSSSTHSNYHRPTVEDTEDEDNRSSAPTPKSVASEATKTATPAPAPAPTEVEKAPTPAALTPTKTAGDRYWLHERSVGEFSRAFSFAKRVDQDRVTATLDNGVLSVTVPKAPRHVVKRVVIF